MFTVDDLIAQRPSLHRHGDGRQANWGVNETVLRFITEHAGPGSKTIETGAGLSTVAFVLTGAEHHAVFPEPYLTETVGAFLDGQGVDRSRLHWHNGPSQAVLPALAEKDFDLALIDGEHAFPAPFLDWYYLGRRLKAGGLLVIDDTQIWTGQVLRNFLLLEPEWRLVKEVYGVAMFRMEAPWQEKWWGKQPYTVLHSAFKPSDLNLFPDCVTRPLRPVYDLDA